MSFGLTSLKKHKDDSKAGASRQHIETVILGHDLAAVLKLMELKHQFGPERLRLITPRLLTRQNLLESYRGSVATLRDNLQTLQIAGKFSDARVLRFDEESVFSKEGQWHKFNSRAKPMQLAPGEEFFLAPRQEVELASLFRPADWDELDHVLQSYQSVRLPEKIEKQSPTDLALRDEWWLLFKDLGEVTCTDLWLSLPARQVLKASQQGQTLPPEAAAWFASVERQAGVQLSWECTKELHPQSRTLFVPQSMTHEWGHFIVDIHPWDEARQCHRINALILLQDEEPSSEVMADKIKLCKRVLERVLPGLEESIRQEFILVSEDLLEWLPDTRPAEAMLVAVPHLHVIGACAAGTSSERYLARSLLLL